jgi:hypothetical protein
MAEVASPEKVAIDASSMEKNIESGNDHGPMFGDLRNADGSSLRSGEDILALQDLDPALNMKMHLVNNVSDKNRGFHVIKTMVPVTVNDENTSLTPKFPTPNSLCNALTLTLD